MPMTHVFTQNPLMSLGAQPSGITTKRCELPLIFIAIGQAVRRWKALDLGSLNMQFQLDWPKDEKIKALLIFCLKT